MITAVEDGFAELQLGGILKIAGDAQAALASPFNRAAARSFYEATVLGVSVSDRLDSRSASDVDPQPPQ